MSYDQLGIEASLGRCGQGKRECGLVVAIKIYLYEPGTSTVMIFLEELLVILVEVREGYDFRAGIFHRDSVLQAFRKSANVRRRLSERGKHENNEPQCHRSGFHRAGTVASPSNYRIDSVQFSSVCFTLPMNWCATAPSTTRWS